MLRVMKLRRWVIGGAIGLLAVALSRPARAFGGTAPNLERQGNFVVTNDAGFAFDQQIGHAGGTTFSVRPALDYFVINHLSIGGAVEFDYTSGHPSSTTQFQIAPEIGYEFSLSDTWSFWPQASVPISVPNPGSTTVVIAIFAPFLVHPAEHFFFGLGPGFAQELTSPATTQITAGFRIGGYFDH
jgi:hypothetical protein